LSETCIMVENSICQPKVWKILKEKYHHWRNGEGQIDGNNILTICATLANHHICKSPPQKTDWMAFDWVEMMDAPPPTPPLLLDLKCPKISKNEKLWMSTDVFPFCSFF